MKQVYTQSMSNSNFGFFRKSPDGRFIQSENPPHLNDKYSYFARMNVSTIILGLIHTTLVALIILLQLIPALSETDEVTKLLIRSLIPVIVGVAVVLYDWLYASFKIIQRDLKNYGIDFLFFGILASIFGYLVGIYLIVKGLVVMIIALTDRSVFAWRYDKPFRQVFSSFMNKFASILGFIILLLKNPYIQPEIVSEFYFYLALGVLIVDVFVLRYLVNRYEMGHIPLWIGIAKLIFGVTACFYYLAGIMLIIEGVIIVFSAMYRFNP